MSVRPAGIRCCSFCRMPNHSVRFCNSVELSEFEENVNGLIERNVDGIRSKVREYIYNYPNVRLLRAFACSRHISSLSNGINIIMDQILTYFEPKIAEKETAMNTLASYIAGIRNNNDGLVDELLFWGFLQLYVANENRLSNKIPKINIVKKKTETTSCECFVCYETANSDGIVELNCGHKLCKECVKCSLQNKITNCGLCRAEFNTFSVSNVKKIRNDLSGMIETHYDSRL